MAETTLTDMAIRKLVARPGQRVELFDKKVPGFAVRATSTGVKSFVLFYRHQGNLRRVTLGRYPVLSLIEARGKAWGILNQSSRGEDPKPKKVDHAAADSFTAAVEQFARLHCAQHNRISTAKETVRLLRVNFEQPWGGRELQTISKGDINAVLDRLVEAGKGSPANHALAAIRKFFNWCVARNLLAVSPCAGITKPVTTRARDRVLDDQELKRIWHAVDGSGIPFEPIVKLLLLTGQRRGEVTAMQWRELDLENRIWSIPAERTKSNRAQSLPLTTAARSILLTIPRFSDVYVFPAYGREDGIFSGFGKSKRKLDSVSGVTGWTLHDLRRTAATGLARLGVAPHVIERILNHTSYTLGGVAGIYNRFGYEPEMRAALDLWSSHVAKLIATPPGAP